MCQEEGCRERLDVFYSCNKKEREDSHIGGKCKLDKEVIKNA